MQARQSSSLSSHYDLQVLHGDTDEVFYKKVVYLTWVFIKNITKAIKIAL